MPDSAHQSLPVLLVLASTYPRWKDDHEPGFVHELCKRLTDRFQVIALVPHALGAARYEFLDGVEVIRYRYAPQRMETLVNDGGIVTNLRRRRWRFLLVPTFVLAQAWKTWRLLRTRRVDVIHAHWLIPQGLIVATLDKLSRRIPPFLVTSHGADLFALRGRWFDALKRFVVRHAAAVTVVSSTMREELTRVGADIGKVTVQPMGVDLTSRFTPDASVLRSPNEILFVGRLVEKKGLRYLIDAMPGVISAYPRAHLTIAGFGPEESMLRRQVRCLSLEAKVQFIGAVPQTQLPALYRRAAVFVAPFVEAVSGDQEGFGLVMVEAIGCECPVVASAVRGTQDLMKEGIVMQVPPADCIALGRAIIAVLSDPASYQPHASEGRQVAMQKFDWTLVTASYTHLLEQLLRTLRSAA